MLLKHRSRDRRSGFTLTESMIAMLIFTAGSMALIPLMMWGIRLQSMAMNASKANALMRAQIEELRVLPTNDPRRSIGGGLDANVTDHFDVPAGTPFILRWLVAAGPAGTQDLRMTVVASNANVVLPPLRIRVILPP